MSWAEHAGLRRNNFDLLRWVLAALVIVSHSYPLTSGHEHDEPLNVVTRGQLTFGALAVDWFFVISGFLITHSWLRAPRVGTFLRKRFLRIYPAYLVAVLLCVLVVIPLTAPQLEAPAQVGWGLFTAYALLLRGVAYNSFVSNPNPAVNGALWSILYECWCYIGVLLLGVTALLGRRRMVLAIFVASIAASVYFEVTRWRPGAGVLAYFLGSPRLWARMLPYFMSGMLLYLYRDRIPFGGALALAALMVLISAARLPYGIAVALPTAGTYLLLWLAFQPMVSLPNWARYGDFSYGLYLYGFPIQQLLVMAFKGRVGPWTVTALALPLTMIAAALSWHLVEKRFLRAKERRVEQLASTAAPAAERLPPGEMMEAEPQLQVK